MLTAARPIHSSPSSACLISTLCCITHLAKSLVHAAISSFSRPEATMNRLMLNNHRLNDKTKHIHINFSLFLYVRKVDGISTTFRSRADSDFHVSSTIDSALSQESYCGWRREASEARPEAFQGYARCRQNDPCEALSRDHDYKVRGGCWDTKLKIDIMSTTSCRFACMSVADGTSTQVQRH